jgi:hypothetical protein
MFALTFEPLDRVLYKAQPTVYDALSKKNWFFLFGVEVGSPAYCL